MFAEPPSPQGRSSIRSAADPEYAELAKVSQSAQRGELEFRERNQDAHREGARK
jgi:hypothetical protein